MERCTVLFYLRNSEDFMSDIWQLYRIQQIDNQLEGLTRKQSDVITRDDLREEMAKHRESIKEAEADLKKQKTILNDKDLEVQKYVTQRKSFEKKLYSGESGNTKELAGWESEIRTLKKKQSVMEDEMLVLMEEIEALEKEIIEKEKAYNEKEEECTRSEDDLRDQQKSLAEEIESLKSKREKIVETIDAPLLAKFDELQAQCDGVAIAKIANGICGGCFMNLPESIIKRMLRREIEFCSNCGRILFADGE